MTNWTKLKKAITDVIKTNGNQEITGAIMQQTLMSIVDNIGNNAQFGGVAVPSTVPADTDGSVFYLASTQGTYPNFSGIKVDASEMAVFTKNTAGSWVKTSLPIQHPTIKKPLLIGGDVVAITNSTGVVLSVPTLNADGTETTSKLSINAATLTNNGVMTKNQVNILKRMYDLYIRMTDFVIGDNDDGALLNVETTQQNSINLKYKTLDTVSGDKTEKTKVIPAVSPMNGTAGVAGMNLVHDIPYFFDFYNTGFTSLLDGSDITKVLIPKFQTGYDVFDDLYTDVPTIQSKTFANPKAGDRILMGSLLKMPPDPVPLWATVTSAQRISNIYSVTVDYDGDTYIFAYTPSNDVATLKIPWTKIYPKRNVYTNGIKQLDPKWDKERIKDYLTPQVYRKYGIIYPIKPQTGDLMVEKNTENERHVAIKVVRNEENPNEYTDILIPESGTANAYTRIVLKNDLTAIKSRNPYYILRTSKRAYDGDLLLALDTVKAETIKNSITKAYSFTIDGRDPGLAAQCPEVGDLIKMQGDDGGDSAPVCETFFTEDNVQYTRWFSKGKLYEVLVNTSLTRVPEDPKVIYDTTSGTLRDLYISAGAVYNEATGFYELNGLTDITEEEMRVIYKYAGTPQAKAAFACSKARTNLPMPGMYNGTLYEAMFYACPNLEVAYLGNRQGSPTSYDVPLIYTEGDYCFYLCKKLKKIYGKIYQRNNWNLTFGYCFALEEVRIAELYSSILLSWSSNLSKESVLYMITNAKPLSGAAVGSITITLHPTAYARLKDDADIVAALEAKGGIVTLVSA